MASPSLRAALLLGWLMAPGTARATPAHGAPPRAPTPVHRHHATTTPLHPVHPVHPAVVSPRGGGPTDLESVQVFQVSLASGCTRVVAVGDNDTRDVVVEVLGPGGEHLQQNAETGPREDVLVCPLYPGPYEVRVHVRGGDREGTTRLFTTAPDGTRQEIMAPAPTP